MSDSYFQLGYVVGPHGLKGELKVILDCDDPGYYEEMESVFLTIKGRLVPFFVETFQLRDDGKGLLKLEGIDSLESAESLKGVTMHLPEELLPELGENQFYYHQVMGYEARDHGKPFGIIKDYYSEGWQELFSVRNGIHEVLVPVIDEFIIRVDHEEKYIDFKLPEGLVELYSTDAD